MNEKRISLAPLLSMPAQQILTQEDIKKNIPHRDPFLLVDEVRIIEDGKTCVGIKHVRGDEYFFKGHFPQKPIMPGVLILESMSQAFGGAIMSRVNETGKGLPLFLGVENAKFRGMVVPGDTLHMPVQILRLGKLSRIYAEAYVNDKLCTQAYLTFILGENLNV